ncbi:MAG TPA: hypothetical protein GXX18_17695 [Bacillales bacterium]|nr:hypothetical protein [Bacillales bacterium]
MERKIVDTINSPLLYITQPVYPPIKPKMQQTYVRRTTTPNYETAQVSPVHDKDVGKQVPVDSIVGDITAAPLKKNSIEGKTTPRKSQIEENKQPIETHLKVETEPIEEIIEEKVEPQNQVMTGNQEAAVNIVEPVSEPINNKVKPKQEPFKKAKIKRKSIKRRTEPKQEPVQSLAEPKKDLLKELLKEKLPGLEGIVEGKPVHIQQQLNKDVAQPKPKVPEIPKAPEAPEVIEVIEVPEVSAVSPGLEENVFSGEILEIEDKERAEKLEAAKEKRKMITTFGIRSSIEKGRKAIAAPKKQTSPLTINDIKNRTSKEQNSRDDSQQAPQNQQEEASIQQEPEVKKPRQKPFKEMSVEEKVEYLVNLPIAVPKVKCEIRTNETTFQGIIAGYTNGVVQIIQRKKPFRVDLKIEDILGINRKSF